MKILIQHRRTKLYVSPAGWTDLPQQARDFQHGDQALEFAARLQLTDVEIIYAFEESRYDFSTGRMDFATLK